MLALVAFAPPALADEPVDLELVLAADVSLSMDLGELTIQRQGYADAIESPEVIEAIKSGFNGAIAVVFMEWAGVGSHFVTVPWQRIASADDARRFAAAIRAAPLNRARRTSISYALQVSLELFEDNGFQGFRRVIDVSGDGPNNQGEPVLAARERVLAQGITINGLPMLIDPPPAAWYNVDDLDVYYEECVIGGFGAFSVPIQDIEHFGEAIQRKLILEIAGWTPPPRIVPAQFSPSGYDCLSGERRWMERMQRFD
ncbi:MAG: DUF1194 domain-containing protein [Geminicoccaceae bacterium]|nr:MAG: DUF1194 domain-containing protein [Geminicoccaceae bacterium]